MPRVASTMMHGNMPVRDGLQAVGSRLVVVSTNERIDEQLALTGIADVIGPTNVIRATERVGATVRGTYLDATAWVEAGRA